MKKIWMAWQSRQHSPALVTLFAVSFIAIFDNLYVWHLVLGRLDLGQWSHIGFALTVFLCINAVVMLLLLLSLNNALLKVGLIFFLILSALIGYFNNLGIIFDELQLRSILSSLKDRNVGEALELTSWTLFAHMLVLGFIPSYVVYKTPLAKAHPIRSYLLRVVLFAVTLGLGLGIVAVNYKYTIHLIGEHKDLESFVNPLYPIVSLFKIVRASRNTRIEFKVLGEDAHPGRPNAGRTVGIMVVGETARADRFALNGYERDTNEYLSQRELINYRDAQACGTTTFFTIPCIFSFLPENRYSPYKAEHESNAMDVLDNAGVHVLWRDNNPNCKSVCDRVATEDMTRNPDPTSPYWNNDEYLDEVMLSGLGEYLDQQPGDVLIVMHQMGSHGPAYFRRFPPEMAKFKPYCQNKAQQQCDIPGLNNSYDNTIVYTDYFLDRVIGFLEERDEQFNSFVFYLSDHGESLGENGVYLHGAPPFLKLKAQFHIPMFLWFSPSYLENHGLDYEAVKRCSGERVSQYYAANTLLSLFGMKTEIYDSERDLLSLRCD